MSIHHLNVTNGLMFENLKHDHGSRTHLDCFDFLIGK